MRIVQVAGFSAGQQGAQFLCQDLFWRIGVQRLRPSPAIAVGYLKGGLDQRKQQHFIASKIALEKAATQVAAQWTNVVQVERQAAGLMCL